MNLATLQAIAAAWLVLASMMTGSVQGLVMLRHSGFMPTIEIGGSVVHEPQPELERGRLRKGRLDLVPDHGMGRGAVLTTQM